MKKTLLLSALLFMTLGFAGCGDEDIKESDCRLAEYRWKFKEYVNIDNSIFEITHISINDNSFTISFDNDGTFVAYCATDWFRGSYAINGENITIVPKIDSFHDKNYDPYREKYIKENTDYYQRIVSCSYYDISDNILKLYLNNKKEYLLFNALRK